MGVQITELLTKKEIELKDLTGKIVAVDAHIFLYQFLTTIRQVDGSLLTDSHGNVTSHLVGLFSRTSNLMKQGLKLVYVFDGKPPELKQREQENRRARKIQAKQQFEDAKKEQDIAGMKKYASRTARLTRDMIEEAKELIAGFGLPIVQAPSEGEAQAAYLVKNGASYCVASQDADSLLFGAPKLVRNVSIAGKRKRTNKLAYETVKPELIELSTNLQNLGLTQDQLITLAMLVGTDYNPGGVKGLGPKKALELVKKHDKATVFKEARWDEYVDTPWQDIFEVIKNMPVTDEYRLVWSDIDQEKITKLLVDKYEFSPARINKGLESFEKRTLQQKGLQEFL